MSSTTKSHTAYVIDDLLWVVEGTVPRGQVHDQICAIWKELVVPSPNVVYEIKSPIHLIVERVCPELGRPVLTDLTTDHGFDHDLPEEGSIHVYHLRTGLDIDHEKAPEMQPMIEEFSIAANAPRDDYDVREIFFIENWSLVSWSEKRCFGDEHPHEQDLFSVRIGGRNHIVVHGDHLELMADYAEANDRRFAKYLREEAEGRAEELANFTPPQPSMP